MRRAVVIAGTVMVGLMGLAVGAGGGGCASGPSVGGFGIFTKYVKVGEIVELSSPYDPQTGLEWRIAAYDSGMLEIRTSPRVVRKGDGYEMVAGFMAKRPGNTEVVFERRGAGAGAGESGRVTRKFSVSVRE